MHQRHIVDLDYLETVGRTLVSTQVPREVFATLPRPPDFPWRASLSAPTLLPP